MHSKTKGNIGQFGISLELSKLGYSIFSEEGDISKIDVIAEKNGRLIRIQCKAITPQNDVLELPLTKSGPNYKFKYDNSMFDYFGVWDLTNHKAYFVPSSVLTTHNKSFRMRLSPPRNNQEKGVNLAEDYSACIIDIP